MNITLNKSMFSRKNFYIFFAIILVMKIIFACGVFYKNPDYVTLPDSGDYSNFARQILAQGVFVPDVTTNPLGLAEIAPGYPLLMSFFYLFSDSPLLQVIFNVIMSHLISLFAFKIGLLLFKNNALSFLSATMVMLSPMIMYYSLIILKEPTSSLLFIWLIYLIILYYIVGKKEYSLKTYIWHIVGIGAITTFLIHTDERFVIHILLIMIVILIFDSSSIKMRILTVISYGVLIILLSLPWAIRNHSVYGRPMFLSCRTAPYSDVLLTKLGFEWENKNRLPLDCFPRGCNAYTSIQISDAVLDSIEAGFIPTSLDLRAVEHIIMGLEVGIRPYQFSDIHRYWSNFIEFFRIADFENDFRASGFVFTAPWSLKHNIISIFVCAIVLPGFIIALFITIKNRIILFMMLLIAWHAFYHIFIEYAEDRYRIPLSPLITIISMYGYWMVYLKWQQYSNNKKITKGVDL
ncbi:MAG: hypothetical protein K8S56_05650 [Candidatus Cloacimonetes bacterium]|nr:hypothetical protein [Candidatus Cloacimonadota bacterium]